MASNEWVLAIVLIATAVTVAAGDFGRDFDLTWGADGYHTQVQDRGRQMQLFLDRASGGKFESKGDYMFGRFDVRMRLVPGNSAGTVTTFYLSSQGDRHDEVDMEFLGNVTGQPYVLHTNIYAAGKGDREEQFYLWFDPARGFHTYSVIWTPKRVVFLVDDTPIRVYGRAAGVAFPETQAMRVYGSLWNADDWATRGGRDKTDWTQAPFSAAYRLFRYQRCLPVRSPTCAVSTPDKWWNLLDRTAASPAPGGPPTSLAGNGAVNEAMQKLRWVQSKYRIYSYCDDVARFNRSRPLDCPPL